jgi:hypothetical protein
MTMRVDKFCYVNRLLPTKVKAPKNPVSLVYTLAKIEIHN